LININELKNKAALPLLFKYNGKNPYLKELRNKYHKNGKITLTETQTKYINEFHDSKPLLINRVIRINTYFGEALKDKYHLSFIPDKILIEFILADLDKTYHIYGKLKRNQKTSDMYWLPKTMVLDDPYFEECDLTIDWDKYHKLDNLGRTLYNHQKTGVEFLSCRDGCILADSMGLGKTITSIISSIEVNAKKILIICPSSIKIAWKRELEAFNEKSTIISGSRWTHPEKYTIINFDILKNFHTIGKKTLDLNGNDNPYHRHLVNEKYDLIIIDEAHKLKEPKTQRGKIVNELVLKYGIKMVWLLTGTPIANRPMDFFNLLKLIKSPLAENWKFFAQRYCNAKLIYKKNKNNKIRKIWITKGASNLGELSIRIKNLMIRRLKTEILDMPDKTITKVYHKLSKRGIFEYEKLWDDYVIKRKESGKRKISCLSKDIVELGLLRKFIAMETIPHTLELIQEAISEGQKVVVFTTFTDELEEIASYFGNECVVHNGTMSLNEKQKSIDGFQNSKKVKIFVGNIHSAGVGITLTEGSVVIFNSFDWVPGNNEQAEDRCFRIGQKNNVSVYYQLFEETISIVMWYSVMNKISVINKIMGENTDDSKRLNMLMSKLDENGIKL